MNIDEFCETEEEEANRYWETARARILTIAENNGWNVTLADHEDEFVYSLFDGESDPSYEEIVEAIIETFVEG